MAKSPASIVKSILIVDDHALFREGLRMILEKDKRYVVIGEAGTAQEALRLVEKVRPDLILMDISLPDINGFQATRLIKKKYPRTQVVIVSMDSGAGYVEEALNSGASGYVLKESAFQRLLEGLERVSRGETFIDSSITSRSVCASA
jgi:DNA-binding NarL/FixJ family response regulator